MADPRPGLGRVGLCAGGLICVVALLGRLRHRGAVDRGALPFVDGVIGAFLAGSAVCLATLAYQSQTVGGPFLWSLALVITALFGVAMALLTWVGRSLISPGSAAAPDPPGVLARS